MWRYLFLCPVYLLSTSLPLVSSVGTNLEYEYALFCSYVVLILVPLVAFFIPDKHIPIRNDQYGPPIAFEFFWIFFIGPFISLAAGLFVFAIGQCSCSETGFFFWMFVLWYPAFIISHAAFSAILRGRFMGISRAKLGGALALIYLLILAFFAIDMWISPQKRAVNLLVGFIHGPIYDNWIAFDGGIMLARASHLALAASLLFVTWLRGQTLLICTIMLSTALWLVTGGLASRWPSVQTGKAHLDELLPGTLEGDGFTVHYYNKSSEVSEEDRSKKETPDIIKRLFSDSEFYISELKAKLDLTDPPHVEIYIYPSNQAKKLWFGGGSTDVTDVYTPSIHITAKRWPHPTLRHELVHALSSSFGFHGLGFHPNMAFTEGLAVALAPSERTLSLDEGAAALIKSGKLPSVEKLFSSSFFLESGRRAYTVAGSLINYLIANYGIAQVKALYGGDDWDDALKEPQKRTLEKWRKHVLSTFNKEKHELFAEALYRYPGVMKDVCPHSKSDLFRRRNESVYVRLRQPISWDPNEDYLPWRLNLNSDDNSARLRVWKKEINKVAKERFASKGRLKTWRSALKNARSIPPKSLEDVEMGILEADILRLLGDLEANNELLSYLFEYSKSHYIGHSYNRQIEARLRLDAVLPEEQGLEWRKFIAGWRRTMPYSSSNHDIWILNYLKIRNSKQKHLSNSYLAKQLDIEPDPEISTSFHLEWYKVLGHRLMRGGKFLKAKTAYSRAALNSTPALHPIYFEHARRAAFYSKTGHTSGK